MKKVKVVKQIKVLSYQRYKPRVDYLKHWHIVRMWAMSNYNMTTNEIEIMLALYSEGLFTQSRFNQITRTYSWDKKRLEKMIQKGYIVLWRKRQANEVAKYDITRSMRKMCASIYRKLDGLEAISEHKSNSPFHQPNNNCYSHRMMRKSIREFNIEMGHTIKPPLD